MAGCFTIWDRGSWLMRIRLRIEDPSDEATGVWMDFVSERMSRFGRWKKDLIVSLRGMLADPSERKIVCYKWKDHSRSCSPTRVRNYSLYYGQRSLSTQNKTKKPKRAPIVCRLDRRDLARARPSTLMIDLPESIDRTDNLARTTVRPVLQVEPFLTRFRVP